MSESKVCKICGIEKPLIDFHLCKGGYLGRRARCKACVSTKKSRTDNIDPKPCSSCGKVKPLTEYSFESNRYRAQCKACKYKQRLKFRSEHPEIYEKERERDRWRRANEPGYRERKNEDTMRSYAKHRDRRLQEHREKWINDDEYRENILQKRKDRWANDSEWRKKRKAENLKYVNEHREELKVKSKIYYVNNKEKISEYGKQFRKDNPDHCRELAAKHYQNHKDKLVQDQRDLRSERKNMIFERIGWVCAHPECNETKNLQIDHRDPLKKSFTITSNLTKNWDELLPEVDKCQPLCFKHHMEKTAKEWENGTLQLSRKLNIKKGKR